MPIKNGDVIQKSFKFTMSKKFPDDTLVVQSFGTSIERVCDSDEDELVLAEQVYHSTVADIIRVSKTDSVTKVITKTVRSQIDKERKRNQAQVDIKNKC